MKAFLRYTVLVIAFFVIAQAAEWQVGNQRVEYMPCPALGIDVPSPRFAWVIDSVDDAAEKARGVTQEAFRITVTSTDDQKIIWDSGKVTSPESRHVAFGSIGQKPTASLQSTTAYDWSVDIWLSSQEKQSIFLGTSPIARFVTGVLYQDEWKDLSWLTGVNRDANICRHEFSINQPNIKRAILVVAGLGYFQATLNGQEVTDAVLETAWTEYKLRVPYSTYDVTSLISTKQKDADDGLNVLGISLGNGWYSSMGGGEPSDVPRMFIAKLMVDGKPVVATSADSWTCAQGPITYDSIYHGEIYDAGVAAHVDGWTRAGFVGQDWKQSQAVLEPPSGMFISPKMPPARRTQEITPISITEPKRGIFVVDFGQNFAGHVALTIPGHERAKAGRNITMRHAEVLQHEHIVDSPQKGMIYVDNLRSARATDVYVFGGEPLQESVVYEPTFTYHGFRYIEIRGFEPRLSDVKGYVIHSDVGNIGSIEFSDPLLNQIQSAIHWGQRSNILSVLTDCPQRDERKGWLGDAQLSGEEALFNFDMVATLIKFLHDIADTQDEGGHISDTAPFTWGHRPADPSWSSAFPSLVYFLYKETGDLQIIKDFYPALVKYINAVIVAAETTGVANLYKSYGDWCPVPGYPMCSPHLTGSFSMLENIQQIKELALALGADYQDDVVVYGTYHSSLSEAFHRAFYNNGTYDSGVQTCLALPLWANITPDNIRPEIVNKLLTDITVTQNYHTTTGIIGLKYMLEVLSQLNRPDIAVSMLQKKDYPSIGYMLHNEYEPATTIWELWDSYKEGPAMNSRNHIMFGGPVGGWFYKYLAGIRPSASPQVAGYREVILSPPVSPCMTLERVSTSIRTLQGLVAMEWSSAPGTIKASINIPVGGKGRVVLDGTGLGLVQGLQVQIDGIDLQHVQEGVEIIKADDDLVELRLPSGAWKLDVKYDKTDTIKCGAGKTSLIEEESNNIVAAAL